jgi:hypothetical protein
VFESYVEGNRVVGWELGLACCCLVVEGGIPREVKVVSANMSCYFYHLHDHNNPNVCGASCCLIRQCCLFCASQNPCMMHAQGAFHHPAVRPTLTNPEQAETLALHIACPAV